MDTETKLVALLANEPSDLIEIEEYNVRLRFQRPSLAGKHRSKGWTFSKMREYGYNVEDNNSGTVVLQYWGQLNSFVTEIEMDGKPYTFDPKKDTEYKYLFEKFVVEEIYTRRGLHEEGFISSAILALVTWYDDGEIEDDELKNS